MESFLCSYKGYIIIMLICTSKSGFNVPDSQFTNQVPAKSQTTVAVVVVVVVKALV